MECSGTDTLEFVLRGTSLIGDDCLFGAAGDTIASVELCPGGAFSATQDNWISALPAMVSPAGNVDFDATGMTTATATSVQGAIEDLDGAIDGHIDGTYLHSEIDTHMDATDNPHGTDIGNLGSGTLAELNAAITDFDLDATGSARPPAAHVSEHLTGGSDEIGVFGGANGGDGTEGLVPPPLVADAVKFLKGDGSWQDVSAGADGSAPIARSFLTEYGLSGNLEIDEVPNAEIELLRGFTYEFFEAVLTSPAGHPFIISTSSEGAALATSLPSDPEDYDYYEDGNNIIFRPSHDAAITSYYYHCDDHAGEGGTILLSTLGEHDEGGGAIVNPYVFTQGNGNPLTPYVIAPDAYHIGVETSFGTLLMSLPDPDVSEVGLTYIISDVEGAAGSSNIDIQVVDGIGAPIASKFMEQDGVQINTNWGYVQVVNVERAGNDRMWIIVSSFGTVLF
ncbi:hypothetical protein CMI47_09620 [Candidatus Pacearchaeota archaeon]|nr:hypothetical protein [Candidatus Pacearchaeota archaeon]